MFLLDCSHVMVSCSGIRKERIVYSRFESFNRIGALFKDRKSISANRVAVSVKNGAPVLG